MFARVKAEAGLVRSMPGHEYREAKASQEQPSKKNI